MNTATVIIILLVENYWCWLFYFEWKIEANPKAPKFKAGDRVRITKYKNILSKGYTKS